MDVFTSADGTDFWTRPIDVYAVGATVTIRYITNGAATGGVQLDQYGRAERHTKDPDPDYADARFDSLSNCDPLLGTANYAEPDYAHFWFCNDPPNWENAACVTPAGDIRNTVARAVGMIVHVDANSVARFLMSTCSVTLVSPDTIITAGHCMTDPIEDARSASVTRRDRQPRRTGFVQHHRQRTGGLPTGRRHGGEQEPAHRPVAIYRWSGGRVDARRIDHHRRRPQRGVYAVASGRGKPTQHPAGDGRIAQHAAHGESDRHVPNRYSHRRDRLRHSSQPGRRHALATIHRGQTAAGFGKSCSGWCC